ncbi:MAG: NDP-hexose 2,3-dehydratase family protein [Pseudomonadota bacterium]
MSPHQRIDPVCDDAIQPPASSDGVQTQAEIWLGRMRERHPLFVERVPLDALERWAFEGDPLRLRHESGKFFSIDGIRTTTDYGPIPVWDQPIINQPEVGILGILTRVDDGVRRYLMQAKVEPGNIGGAQIAPTLQATWSNYNRVHGGARPKYLEYFIGERPARVRFDQPQPEQASRFLKKLNRNVVLEIDEEPLVHDEFRWFTLEEIKLMLRSDNIVNMDARSVLSCIGLATRETLPHERAAIDDFGASLLDSANICGSLDAILAWLSDLRARHHFDVTRRGLDRLDAWELTSDELRHREGQFFSVIGARARINSREVCEWMQPLVYHAGKGLNGFVAQRIDDVLHFLVRACFYPGNRSMFELGPTISRSNYESVTQRMPMLPFIELFLDPPAGSVRHSSIQSEEGGRFYHYQNRYMILELPEGSLRDHPPEYRWMTLGQIQRLLGDGLFTIEARNLLACLSLG